MTADDAEQTPDTAASALVSAGHLDGLKGNERRERAELIEWLLDRGFTADQIQHSLAPMLLAANRVLGDDGVYVSEREVAESTGIDLDVLQRLERAAGLPKIEDPDAAVLPRADALAVGRAKVSAIRAALKGRLLNGLITDEATAGAILKA